MEVRRADLSEVDRIGQVWYDAWQDGHRALMPAELIETRTLGSFQARIREGLDAVRVVGPRGGPVGFCMIKEDELYQLFVAREARGFGAAVALLSDGEARLAATGVRRAWLSCAIGNDRAARFYQKCGWELVGNMTVPLETLRGLLSLETWRYEKTVAPE